MSVVINELSFSGQFSTVDSFLESLTPLIVILRTCVKLRIDVLKKSDFYSSQITPREALIDIIRDKTAGKSEEIRGLTKELAKFSDTPPYWDLAPRHSCANSYTCKFTDLTCQYGLAESVECDKVVISCQHPNFSIPVLDIQKDSESHKVDNIFSKQYFGHWIIKNIELENISFDTSDYLFPQISESINVFSANSLYTEAINLSTNEKVSKYKETGHKVAIINGWVISKHITEKNDRNIYSKTIRNNVHYLSIDTQHGTFELFDHTGEHLGEVDFLNVKKKNSKSHSIKV